MSTGQGQNKAMFSRTVGEALRALRKENKKSQEIFAAEFGIGQRRWSKFECGILMPTTQELDLIQARYGRLGGSVAPESFTRKLIDNAKGHRPLASLYLPPCDRTSRIRYCAALERHGDFVRQATSVIRARSDFQHCQALCNLLSLGSGDEVLPVLSLLKQGALPGAIAPTSLGNLPHAAVDPRTRKEVGQLLCPCLSFPGDFYFFQVTLSTPRLFTPDILRWHEGRWSVIEMDGRGHDHRGDDERTALLNLRVTRLTPETVISGGLWNSGNGMAA